MRQVQVYSGPDGSRRPNHVAPTSSVISSTYRRRGVAARVAAIDGVTH